MAKNMSKNWKRKWRIWTLIYCYSSGEREFFFYLRYQIDYTEFLTTQ